MFSLSNIFAVFRTILTSPLTRFVLLEAVNALVDLREVPEDVLRAEAVATGVTAPAAAAVTAPLGASFVV